MPTIVGFAGSLRRDSLNRRLIAASVKLSPEGMSIDVFDDLGDVPLYNADTEAATVSGPSAVQSLRAQVAAADGVLISTPEYNQSLPAVTKNAVDWLSRAGGGAPPLKGKPVAIMGASDGPWGTRYSQKELRHTLTASGALVLPTPMVFVAKGDEVFDENGDLSDATLTKRITRLLEAFERWIDVVSE